MHTWKCAYSKSITREYSVVISYSSLENYVSQFFAEGSETEGELRNGCNFWDLNIPCITLLACEWLTMTECNSLSCPKRHRTGRNANLTQ